MRGSIPTSHSAVRCSSDWRFVRNQPGEETAARDLTAASLNTENDDCSFLLSSRSQRGPNIFRPPDIHA